MPLKNIYTIKQFPNQIEFAEYMLKSIYDGTMIDIVFNGTKKQFFQNHYFKRFTTRPLDYELKNDIMENYYDFMVVESSGRTSVRRPKKESTMNERR